VKEGGEEAPREEAEEQTRRETGLLAQQHAMNQTRLQKEGKAKKEYGRDQNSECERNERKKARNEEGTEGK